MDQQAISRQNMSENVAGDRKKLTQEQVVMIEEALASLGSFGEVRLVVEKGRLRFLVTQKSFDALNWKSGTAQEL
jgi:hypothetical protein